MNLKIRIRCLFKLRKRSLIFKRLFSLIQAQVKNKKTKKKPLLYNLRLRPCFLSLILQFCVGCTIYDNSNENHEGCSSPHLAHLSCLLPHGLCFLTANKISPLFPLPFLFISQPSAPHDDALISSPPFHLARRVSPRLLNKVSVGVIGPEFALTNRAGCCSSAAAAAAAAALSGWFSFRWVCVCLCQVDARNASMCVCVSTSLCGCPTSQPPVTPTHTFVHTPKCAWRANAFGNISAPAAGACQGLLLLQQPLSNPNENSCYILNSHGDVGCLAIILSLLSAVCRGAKFKFISARKEKYILKYLWSKRMRLIQLTRTPC